MSDKKESQTLTQEHISLSTNVKDTISSFISRELIGSSDKPIAKRLIEMLLYMSLDEIKTGLLNLLNYVKSYIIEHYKSWGESLVK